MQLFGLETLLFSHCCSSLQMHNSIIHKHSLLNMDENLHRSGLKKSEEQTSKNFVHIGDGKIIWLIGSSMLRDAFDETYINEELSKHDSSYRVFKIGMNRGSAGVVYGLFAQLPIEKGDQVFINVHGKHILKENGWLFPNSQHIAS